VAYSDYPIATGPLLPDIRFRLVFQNPKQLGQRRVHKDFPFRKGNMAHNETYTYLKEEYYAYPHVRRKAY